jgi:hypothetical protein
MQRDAGRRLASPGCVCVCECVIAFASSLTACRPVEARYMSVWIMKPSSYLAHRPHSNESAIQTLRKNGACTGAPAFAINAFSAAARGVVWTSHRHLQQWAVTNVHEVTQQLQGRLWAPPSLRPSLLTYCL